MNLASTNDKIHHKFIGHYSFPPPDGGESATADTQNICNLIVGPKLKKIERWFVGEPHSSFETWYGSAAIWMDAIKKLCASNQPHGACCYVPALTWAMHSVLQVEGCHSWENDGVHCTLYTVQSTWVLCAGSLLRCCVRQLTIYKWTLIKLPRDFNALCL